MNCINYMPIKINQTNFDNYIPIVLPLNHRGVVDYIANGVCFSKAGGRYVHLGFVGKDVNEKITRFLDQIIDKKNNEPITLYVNSIHKTENNSLILLLSNLEETTHLSSDYVSIKEKATEEWDKYVAEKKVVEEKRKKERESLRAISSQAKWKMDDYGAISGYGVPDCPEPQLGDILERIPLVIFVDNLPKSSRQRERAIKDKIASYPHSAPRNSEYDVYCFGQGRQGDLCAIVEWLPREASPSYLEIKHALIKTMPRVLRRPRLDTIEPPDFDCGTEEEVKKIPLSEIIDDLMGDSDDWEEMTPLNESCSEHEGSSICQESGFEAVAWYQSFHVWNEERWGIYIHAGKLDDLYKAFYQDMRSIDIWQPKISFLCVLGLVYHHEMFHAWVEANGAWLELVSNRASYLKYKDKVYNETRLTDRCLEEAFANWASYKWLTDEFLVAIDVNPSKKDAIIRLVEDWLDFSPPGYREWRRGADTKFWREFASQVKYADKFSKPKSRPRQPLENLVAVENRPYDLVPSDIPFFVVGQGILTDTLFSTPSYSEARKVLKHFDYSMLPGRAKGSHEFWKGPDQRGFVLPKRDPLSMTVFKKMLAHFDLNKQEYVNSLRRKI